MRKSLPDQNLIRRSPFQRSHIHETFLPEDLVSLTSFPLDLGEKHRSTSRQICHKSPNIAHAYSSLLLKATQNFKISDATPGFDIFNFLLPRDQIDVIPNLDIDVN